MGQVKQTCYGQIVERYLREQHKPRKNRKLVVFVSDKFVNYRNAFNKLFLNVATLRFGIPIKARLAGLKHNNNHIERHNGKIKDRIKTMRGGFGSFEGAEAFMNLYHLIHNFVNPHQGLKGKTPAEAAEIILPLGRNKLLDLILYVAKKSKDVISR